MLLEFAISPVWVWQFVGETPTNLALGGGMIVIVSVLGRTLIELFNAGKPSGHGASDVA